MRRLTLDLNLDQVAGVVATLDAPRAIGFVRLHGGSTEVYRIDLGGAEPVVSKIDRDEPA